MPQEGTKGKRPIQKGFLFNLVVILLICLALYWIFFASLGSFTRHGQAIPVPTFTGLTLSQAENLASTQGFTLDIDSTFAPGQKPLTVLNQQPDPASLVKKGHTISITVNKIVPPSVPMPSLINLSYQSALLQLKNNKLLLKDTVMKPDMAQGAVLDQLLNGQSVKPGTLVGQGSAITLVVGDGIGKTMMNVPNIVGMSYPEAVALLSGSNLTYRAFFDGTITDTTSAVVYLQIPSAVDSLTKSPNTIKEGMVIGFHVKQNN